MTSAIDQGAGTKHEEADSPTEDPEVPPMRESRGLWFVVASWRSVRLIVNETVSGRYGRVGNAAVAALSGESVEYSRDSRFGWLVAKLLNEACARNLIDGIVLVAPRRLRRTIREGLDPAAEARIVAEVSESLSRYQDSELSKRLAEIPLGLHGEQSAGSTWSRSVRLRHGAPSNDGRRASRHPCGPRR